MSLSHPCPDDDPTDLRDRVRDDDTTRTWPATLSLLFSLRKEPFHVLVPPLPG